MINIDGSIISGEAYPETHEFVITKVKSFETASVLSVEKMNAIYDYLSKATHYDDFHVITINDQLPIKLDNTEVLQILKDLEQVRKELNV